MHCTFSVVTKFGIIKDQCELTSEQKQCPHDRETGPL
jgi:hypothetical protein